jgi:periplasmic protein TonB
MCQLCVRLFVALLTFAVGLLASVLFGAMRTAEAPAPSKTVGVFVAAPRVEAPAPRVYVEDASQVVRGGVLNERAFLKPEPVYPTVARAAGLRGTVVVEVTVDEGGRVSSAEAVSGQALLRQAAVEAAREARFKPTLLSGRPVRVSGFLTYNFVPE